MPDNFRQFLRLLEPDNIFLPKDIVARKDISEHTKIMLGVIFTRYRFDTDEKVRQALENLSDDDIAAEFGNNPAIINRIHSDVKKYLSTL